MAFTSREIAASVSDTFRVISDPTTYPDWLVGASHIRDVDDQWPAPGSRFHHRVGVGPVSLPDHSTVLDFEPDRMLRLMVKARPFLSAVVTFRVTGDHERCVVTLEERMANRIIRYVARLVADPLIHVRNHHSLKQLGRVVEARTAKVPPR